MTEKNSAALLVLSGGQDSTTCGYWARNDGGPAGAGKGVDELHGVTFNYGQLHWRELDALKKIGEMLELSSHEFIEVGPVLKGTSPLINSDQELEQYEDHQSLPGGLEKTFVPARNALFLTLAANRAYCLGINDIITGVCEEDNGGYPDCRADFILSMESTLSLAHDFEMWIHTPLMHMDKAASVNLALDLPGCYEALAYSHTSYDGAYPPTGKDHATLLREKGFDLAGVPDPLVMRAWIDGDWKGPLPNYDCYKDFENANPKDWDLEKLAEKVNAK